ncbi:MAG: hypothetical protein E7490_06580 [Ruminococcaceae bacterium]|nr:hypothetical protein [Oscillospiraceae bacterium]
MTKKERTKRAISFCLKKTFKICLAFFLWAVIYLFFVLLSGLIREPIGHEDYFLSSVFTTIGTGIPIVAASLMMTDVHITRYLRVSPCYKEIYTIGKPFALSLSGVLAMMGVVITNIISLVIGNIDMASFNDILIFGAIGVALTLILAGIHYSGAYMLFLALSLSMFVTLFNPDFLRYGFGFDTAISCLIAIGLLAVSIILCFVMAKISYGRRDSRPINSMAKTMQVYNTSWSRR